MCSDESSHGETVSLRVPARPGQLTMVRALTETCLLIADLALDDVTDVQIAVDEIATMLIGAAVAGSSIECDFAFDDRRVSVRVVGTVVEREPINEYGLGWHVTRAVTETLSADLGQFDIGQGGYPIAVRFDRMLKAVGGPIQ